MKKIMFNDRYDLTQAVLEGRKTMTRRIINPQPTTVVDGPFGLAAWYDETRRNEDLTTRYKVGEVVAVAQRYEAIHEEIMSGDYGDDMFDAFRGAQVYDSRGRSNKMYIKPGLMPHQIRITGVRFEQLQDISDVDCMREGVRVEFARNGMPMYYIFDAKRCREIWFDTPREAFAALIDKVSGRGTWERNPWVWVYEFELVK